MPHAGNQTEQTLSRNEWMRPPRAAAYVGVSVSTLAKLRVAGGGPPFSKAGRAVIYSRTALDAWLQAKSRSSTSVIA